MTTQDTDFRDPTLKQVATIAEDLAARFCVDLTDVERRAINKWIREFGYDGLVEAIEDSCELYLRWSDGQLDLRSWRAAFLNIPREATTWRRYREMPDSYKLRYTQGTLRNHIRDDDFWCLDALEAFVRAGVNMETLQRLATRATSWDSFKISVGRAQEEPDREYALDLAFGIAPNRDRNHRRAEDELAVHEGVIEALRAFAYERGLAAHIGDHVALLMSSRVRSDWGASIASFQNWIDGGLFAEEIEALAERVRAWDDLVNRAADLLEGAQ